MVCGNNQQSKNVQTGGASAHKTCTHARHQVLQPSPHLLGPACACFVSSRLPARLPGGATLAAHAALAANAVITRRLGASLGASRA